MTKICSVEGCGKKHKAKGLCQRHYFRMYTKGTTQRVQKPIAIGANRIDRAIDAKAPTIRLLGLKGVSKVEYYTMRRVMKDTGGNGGPWFQQYSMIKGFL